MTKREKFIQYVENVIKNETNAIDSDVLEYWDIFKSIEEKEKPILTDNGKIVLKYMQDNADIPAFRAKDIAEGLFVSSRTVSGSMRKLVTDGFCEKIEKDPVVYTLTEKGKNLTID